MLSLENNGPGYYFISASLTFSLGALAGTNFNPVPGSLDVIKQPVLIHCQFFRKQGILTDEGDGDGIDGDE